MVALGLGVGRNVLDEFVPQGALVDPDSFHVIIREVNGEVVWGVSSGDAHHTVLVHLLGEALGDLDRMDLTSEGTAKDPLYEGLHTLLYQLEETQRTYSPSLDVRYFTIPYIIAATLREVIACKSASGVTETARAYPIVPPTTASVAPNAQTPNHSATEITPAIAAHRVASTTSAGYTSSARSASLWPSSSAGPKVLGTLPKKSPR